MKLISIWTWAHYIKKEDVKDEQEAEYKADNCSQWILLTDTQFKTFIKTINKSEERRSNVHKDKASKGVCPSCEQEDKNISDPSFR